MSSKTFAGVPAGRVDVTPLPNVIFSEVLPEIDDLAEAQVTLHVFYLLYHKKGSPRFVTPNELKADATLRRALARSGAANRRNPGAGFEESRGRGTLLHVVSDGEERYLFNTAESRTAIERLERGEGSPHKRFGAVVPVPQEPPNIFKLYEQNIGTLTPLIAEELKEADRSTRPK